MTLDEMLADEAADPAEVEKLMPGHWTSPSHDTWMLGYGMHLLAPYGRRRFSVAFLLTHLGFLFDNPEPRDSVRVSMTLLCHWSGRTEATTRRYLAILHEADIVLTGPDDTYSRGLWFPYPTTPHFREP